MEDLGREEEGREEEGGLAGERSRPVLGGGKVLDLLIC